MKSFLEKKVKVACDVANPDERRVANSKHCVGDKKLLFANLISVFFGCSFFYDGLSATAAAPLFNLNPVFPPCLVS